MTQIHVHMSTERRMNAPAFNISCVFWSFVRTILKNQYDYCKCNRIYLWFEQIAGACQPVRLQKKVLYGVTHYDFDIPFDVMDEGDSLHFPDVPTMIQCIHHIYAYQDPCEYKEMMVKCINIIHCIQPMQRAFLTPITATLDHVLSHMENIKL
jgi:hypothetical protein